MGMSTHAVGFKPPDEKWRKMKAVWDACKAAGVGAPKDVETFFLGDEPDEAGVEVGEGALEKCGALREWRDDGGEGYEILIDKLPADVKVVRIYNSW